jgi:hypothetical protein
VLLLESWLELTEQDYAKGENLRGFGSLPTHQELSTG